MVLPKLMDHASDQDNHHHLRVLNSPNYSKAFNLEQISYLLDDFELQMSQKLT